MSAISAEDSTNSATQVRNQKSGHPPQGLREEVGKRAEPQATQGKKTLPPAAPGPRQPSRKGQHHRQGHKPVQLQLLQQFRRRGPRLVRVLFQKVQSPVTGPSPESLQNQAYAQKELPEQRSSRQTLLARAGNQTYGRGLQLEAGDGHG